MTLHNPSLNAGEQAVVDKFLRENRAFLEPDQEIQRNHHVNPRSARESEVFQRPVSDHLLSEIRSGLQSALDETFSIAEMTVATPAAQCGDMSTGYFTATGDLSMASTRGVAGFTVSLHYTIRFILKYFKDDKTVGIREGDAFLVNDCRYGGIHSPDQHLFMPIFHQGELVAWNCCAMHEGEIGARVPGGMGPGIESVWDEGFRGSPIRIVENYSIRTDLATLVQNNSREPHIIMADLKARLAACRRMEKRFHEQVASHGSETLIYFLRANVEYMREEGRRRIQELPDGTMRTQFYIDTTMRENALLKVVYNFTVKGDRIIVDMRGSAPELANRPINSLLATQSLAIAVALAHQVWPDLPCAQAVIDRFEFISDKGTIVDCNLDVPVALCIQPMFKAITAAEIAFAKFYYGSAVRYAKTKAAWFNQPISIIYGGLNQHNDSVGNMCAELNGMAGGAKCDEDGEHSLAPNFGATTDIGETELVEEGLPFIYAISKRLWPDNTGFGKYRGGAAYQFGLMRFGDQPFGFQSFCGGSFFPSTQGLFGGYACPTYAVCRIRGKNLFTEFKHNPELFDADMFSLMNNQSIEGASYDALSLAVPFEWYPEGELFMLSQGAGGGYGDVLERDPNLVVKDLEQELVTVETAVELYGVDVNPVTLHVDVEKTVQRRDAIRQQRLAQGLSWDDFVAKHVSDSPPEHIPYYGSWNEETQLYAGELGKMDPDSLPTIMLPDPLEAEVKALKLKLSQLQSSARS